MKKKKRKTKKQNVNMNKKNKETLYSGQFTLLTQSIKLNYQVIPLH
mgnify:CR=1 FL=1